MSECQSLVACEPLITEFTTDGIITRGAASMGMSVDSLVNDLLFSPMSLPLDEQATESLAFVPPMTVKGERGLRPSDVMVITKEPSIPESNCRRYHAGPVGSVWTGYLREKKINPADWMAYAVVPYKLPEFIAGKGQLKEKYAKDGRQLLARAMTVVNPKYLVLMGADAFNHVVKLFCHIDPNLKNYKFTDCRGSIIDFPGGIKAVCVTAPSRCLVEPEVIPELQSDLDVVELMLQGKTDEDGGDWAVDITYIDNFDDLLRFSKQMVEEDHSQFAIDLEWGKDETLRTIQICWHPHKAAVLEITKENLDSTELFTEWEQTKDILDAVLNRDGNGIIGHNVRGDIRILRSKGLDLMDTFLANGWDTMVAYHMIPGNETLDKKLELVSILVLNAPRYDLELRKWLSENGLSKKTLDEVGYGTVPSHILVPYGAMDAVCTFRLAEYTKAKLKEYPQTYELYTEVIHPVNDAVLEIEENGMFVDKARYLHLSELIKNKVDELKKNLQKAINWEDQVIQVPKVVKRKVDEPYTVQLKNGTIKQKTRKVTVEEITYVEKFVPGFNPDSPDNVKEVLFGQFKVNSQGESLRKAPEDALILNLTPIKATDDTDWTRVVENEQDHLYSASTDAESLGMLEAEHPFAKQLQVYKFVNQVRKTFVKDARIENGEYVFEGGLGSHVQADGAIHPSIKITLETGRYSSSPNLQNLPKKQESEMRKLFEGEEYYPVRTMFAARPGHVLVEADWNQAELWTMGYLSGDEGFIQALMSGDIHTQTTLRMFGAEEYKGRLLRDISPEEFNKLRKEDGYLDSRRIVGKSIIFGTAYSRGAAAIVREVNSTGVECSLEDAQNSIDQFHQTYPDLSQFFTNCKNAVIDPGYIFNPFGRGRKFPPTDDRKLLAGMQREAGNFP